MIFTSADRAYQDYLKQILDFGDQIHTRNHPTYSNIFLPKLTFTDAPIVTFRKTAWKKALREMEWFLSGEEQCPEELLDWWAGQLDDEGDYVRGYGTQLRNFGLGYYDQIAFIKRELKDHPNSRRLLTTTWNPDDMEKITTYNDNLSTPTTCHGTLTQYFVRNGSLHLKTYQRSADCILGVPHNWIQYWAYMLWLAHWADLQPGSLTWDFGDAHIYDEESHMLVANQIIYIECEGTRDFTLVYNPTSEEFKASDFSFIEKLPEALIKTRPKLL